MKTNNNLLTSNDLSIGYKSKSSEHVIAKDININLEAGKLIALIGENGIGKSTLLRTLSGLKKPLYGSVYLNERNLTDYSQVDLAQNLSLVLTEKLPPSNLTVFELIALGRQPYTNWIGRLTESDLEKINQAIALTQIEHLAQKKYYEISDGQFQNVLVARALAQDTPLIILDEPSTHLDLFHKVALFKLLKKLASESNKCILFSTHDIDLAIQLSDEMIVMTQGKVVQDQPCNLISEGIFDTLFTDENIKFDSKKGRFMIR
jgi:iron complex transport system ATP-binding protein